MFENIVYPIIGFTGTLVALEVAWHFTACKISDKTIKLWMFKQVASVVVPSSVRR
jgi:hypothetical protein